MTARRFEVIVTAPSDDDREALDAEQIQRWIAEHRPHHSISVRRMTDDLAAEGDRLHAAVVWLMEREPFTAEHGADPCNRCGHGAYFHRLDDALNLDLDDPTTPFRCIWPMPDGPAVSLCDCPDHVKWEQARHAD